MATSFADTHEAAFGAPAAAAPSAYERGRHRIAFAGLFLFTLLLYARPNEALGNKLGDFPIVKIVAIASLLAYAVGKLAAAEKLTVMPIELKMILLITLLGFALIPFANSTKDSIDLLTDLFLKVVAIFILMINLLDTRKRLLSIVRLVVIAGTTMAVLAISNYLAGKFTVLDKHVAVRIEGVVGGVFGNPNDLATSLVLLVPLAVMLGMRKRGAVRLTYLGFAVILGVAVIFTFSRGGFLGLVACGSVLLWRLARQHAVATVLSTVLLIGVFLATMPVGYSARLTSMFDSSSDPTGSIDARRDLLNRALDLAIRHPIIGLGMGNFHYFSIQEQKAHNSYLEIAAELGVTGLIAYLIMLFAPFRSLRRIERATAQSNDPLGREKFYLTVGIQASLAGYLVCSLFGSIQYLWFVYYPLAYAVSLRRIHSIETLSEEPTEQASTTHKPAEGVLWQRYHPIASAPAAPIAVPEVN